MLDTEVVLTLLTTDPIMRSVRNLSSDDVSSFGARAIATVVTAVRSAVGTVPDLSSEWAMTVLAIDRSTGETSISSLSSRRGAMFTYPWSAAETELSHLGRKEAREIPDFN